VDLPIQNGDFPVRYVNLPEGRGIDFGKNREEPIINCDFP
jgi:hypothetical protein